MRIDAHQHFWIYSEQDYGWIDESMKGLKRDFLPEHLAVELEQCKLDGSIVVQARQTLQETEWLLELAKKNSLIKGVVGWIDLKADNISDQLNQWQDVEQLKGFRHVLQDEPEPLFMLNPSFVKGLKQLSNTRFVYDLLVFHHQLPQSIELVNQVPELPIVLDHIAKPDIKNGQSFKNWENGIRTLAQHSHVMCKVSGMVTEADWQNWQADDFEAYLDVIFSAFGPERIMYGSDWPVCLVAGNYQKIFKIIEEYVNKNCPSQCDLIFGQNAASFYKVS
ncbi:amidohydrolase family protein [Gayadomonas joobiniege]|uniref:amidohydrolase family protein n=1 Tax=Gayadomonas joobiniege TaxID=1234606 RepID=UPI00036550C7|nr:amidohydrolase family protein [Gayadomonas joobiniege]